jgi:hypothetical protein
VLKSLSCDRISSGIDLTEILRKIFGPTKERDGTWRIKTNDELIN